jgi:hypothetical protein
MLPGPYTVDQMAGDLVALPNVSSIIFQSALSSWHWYARVYPEVTRE